MEKKSDIFVQKKKKIHLSPTKFGTGFIRQIDSTKSLVFVIDERLTFKNHFNTVSSKISRACGFLYRLNKVFPYEQMKNFVPLFSFVIFNLLYRSMVQCAPLCIR